MQRTKTIRIVAGVVVGALFAVTTAWAALAGVVTAISKRDVTVAEAAYPFTDETIFEDMTRHPIAFSEVKPGVAVELELDEQGRVVLLRAAVVR